MNLIYVLFDFFSDKLERIKNNGESSSVVRDYLKYANKGVYIHFQHNAKIVNEGVLQDFEKNDHSLFSR